MKITEVSIRNYKSLKDISIQPKDLSVLVGANASGKSNFSDCVDFVAETYRHGLEIAVARKGGYENIAFRRKRRSMSPISVDLHAELATEDLRFTSRKRPSLYVGARFNHTFDFVARGYSIRASYEISTESIEIQRLMGFGIEVFIIQAIRGIPTMYGGSPFP